MSADMTSESDLAVRACDFAKHNRNPEASAIMRDALTLIAAQNEEIKTLRTLKDGYYTSMAHWREAQQSGMSFEDVQAKYSGEGSGSLKFTAVNSGQGVLCEADL